MQARELRLLKDAELLARLEEAHRVLFTHRQEWYMGQLEDNNQITAAKREIARIKTILRERELAGMIEGGAE